MLSQNQAIHLPPSLIILLLILFVMVACVLIYLNQKNWRKLTKSFNTSGIPSLKIPWNKKDNATIEINSRKYRAVVLTSEKGLSISQYGLMPKLFLSGQAFIPWSACSPIYLKQVKVLGMTFKQYFTDVNAENETLQLMIPENIAQNIIEVKYLQVIHKDHF